MTAQAGKGKSVTWIWGSGIAQGKVEESFARRVQRTLKGARVVKNGSAENPALLIRQTDGDRSLKLRSELTG